MLHTVFHLKLEVQKEKVALIFDQFRSMEYLASLCHRQLLHTIEIHELLKLIFIIIIQRKDLELDREIIHC